MVVSSAPQMAEASWEEAAAAEALERVGDRRDKIKASDDRRRDDP